MGARILSLLAVLVLVAGCSSTPKDTGAVTTDSNTAATEGMASVPVPGADALPGVTPGTQQDLVVNVGDRVFFGYDKSDLTAEARAAIEKQANWLKTYPSINVMVEGHCDERGTREYNLALGERRAAAVRNYLIALGVDSGRVHTISYGKERPAVTGSDESAWSQNRRGVLVVQ